MKLSQKVTSLYSRLALVVTLCLIQSVSWAQDKGIDVDIDLDKGGNWYANPIVWVIGGAVFILLLVALLRSSNKGA
ncbi:MAG: hypothetical protein M3R25_09425 [Bacteroidota bacterium]|nr:hypothetical protein [Bacteroidota bacterium]